jgi:hypothetical protein
VEAKPQLRITRQVIHYPPTTQADLRGLAAEGDASALHEFDSESVGLVGACPQPKREVTVDPNVTGSTGAANLDPNATNLKYTLTLDLGGVLTSQQEYVVTY